MNAIDNRSSVDLLTQLVKFNTVSSESNLALIAWIEAYLQQYGVISKRIDETDNKASLMARIGPEAPGGLVFSGHTDVVPVASQPWSRDPFTLWQENDRYYGRGTCDMKGFIACVLAQVPRWAHAPLRRPIYLAFTRDEEIGCLGANAMAQALAQVSAQSLTEDLTEQSQDKPLVIVGEPTLMQPVVAQKGITSFRTTVYGQAAHSSQVSQGVSAVHVAAKLINDIELVMDKLVENGEVDEGFNVPFSSLHVGIVNGGTAINVKAQECYFDWEIRHLPTQTMQAVMAYVDEAIDQLKQQYPGLEINTDWLSDTVPALSNQDNQQLFTLIAKHLAGDITPQYVAYATEAGTFQQHGFETVILGPGSIEQAHQPDEWVAAEQIATCDRFLQAVVSDYCEQK